MLALRHLGRAAALGRRWLTKNPDDLDMLARAAATHQKIAVLAEAHDVGAATRHWYDAEEHLVHAWTLEPGNRARVGELGDHLREFATFLCRHGATDLAGQQLTKECRIWDREAQANPRDMDALTAALGCHQRATRLFFDNGDSTQALSHAHRACHHVDAMARLDPESQEVRFLCGQAKWWLGRLLSTRGHLEPALVAWEDGHSLLEAMPDACITYLALYQARLAHMEVTGSQWVDAARHDVTRPKLMEEPDLGGLPAVVRTEVATSFSWTWGRQLVSRGTRAEGALTDMVEGMAPLRPAQAAAAREDPSVACSIAVVWRNTALAMSAMGREVEALALLDDAAEALLHWTAMVPPGHRVSWELSLVLEESACLVAREGDPDEALAMLERAVQLTQAVCGNDPGNLSAAVDLARQRVSLGVSLVARGRREDALDLLEPALTSLTRLHQLEPRRMDLDHLLRTAHLTVAKAYLAMDDKQRATSHAARALAYADALCERCSQDESTREKQVECAIYLAKLMED